MERILETAEAVTSGGVHHEDQGLAEADQWMGAVDDPWEISSESSEEQADLVEVHSASKKRDRPLPFDS